MVNWKCLGMAVLCAATFIGGCMVLAHFFPNVWLALIAVTFVCMVIFSFYMILGDISEKDNS